MAGKAAGCEGCPNQEICAASKPVGPDPDLAEGTTFQLSRKKTTPMHSGCDPFNSEKIGLISNKMPVRILEKRETDEVSEWPRPNRRHNARQRPRKRALTHTRCTHARCTPGRCTRALTHEG